MFQFIERDRSVTNNTIYKNDAISFSRYELLTFTRWPSATTVLTRSRHMRRDGVSITGNKHIVIHASLYVLDVRRNTVLSAVVMT